MVKVKCRICGNTSYTAAPSHLICKCGGKFKVIPESGQREKAELDKDTLRLFGTSSLINQFPLWRNVL